MLQDYAHLVESFCSITIHKYGDCERPQINIWSVEYTRKPFLTQAHSENCHDEIFRCGGYGNIPGYIVHLIEYNFMNN